MLTVEDKSKRREVGKKGNVARERSGEKRGGKTGENREKEMGKGEKNENAEI